ncbi:MAG: VWA domain-containing protein, partial [Alphaproteobacteria bacterium]
WEGPDNDGDYVTIVPAGAGEREYLDYAYTSNGSPASVTAPDEPGGYEVRYVNGQSKTVLASTAIGVVPVEGSVEAPAKVAAGAGFDVVWEGPDNDGDYVTIVPAGAGERVYLDYAYTTNGSPASLTAPDDPGAYEVRYVTGQSKTVLASAAIAVAAVEGSVEAPATVAAGADFDVVWDGPDNDGDYVTIVSAGAGERDYLDYAYTRNGSPAPLRAPDEPGEYEVRYVTGQSKTVLASAAIAVAVVDGSVEAPAKVGAGAGFEVVWEGPDNDGDYITIVPAGAGARDYLDYAYTSNGSPASLTAPDEPGAYEVRYVTGQSKTVLAGAAILVR